MKITDTYHVKGRGLILVGRHEGKEFEIGEQIEHDGKRYKIVGIERFVKPMHPPMPGDNVGLVVKEIGNAKTRHQDTLE